MNLANELITVYGDELLIPLGFRRSGLRFYIRQSPNIMVLHEKVSRGGFEGFYLALTHDFISNTRDRNGALRIPTHLEEYPVSISAEVLAEQYGKHNSIVNFAYNLNYLSREILPSRKFSNPNSLPFLRFAHLQEHPDQLEAYIHQTIEIISRQGMRLLNEFSPQVSYRAVTRYNNDHPVLDTFKRETELFLRSNNMAIPARKDSWFKRLWRD